MSCPNRDGRLGHGGCIFCSAGGSGEFAITVGFPAKSGVGGGIMGVIPRRLGIGVFAPSLDRHGNSVAGVQLLARLSKELDLGIY